MTTALSPAPPAALGGGARRWPADQALALGALVFLLGVSAAWWALALWPPPAGAPAWLEAARAVCFGAHDGGLPGAGGWILLVGEPLGMFGALLLVWRDATLGAVRRLRSTAGGRIALGAAVLFLIGGLAAAGWRVATATTGIGSGTTEDVPEAFHALVGPAPPLEGLVDQHGDALSVGRFRGRPLLVVFAYAHCETVCPLLVREAMEAQEAMRTRGREGIDGTEGIEGIEGIEDDGISVVVVTLDPWRDTPARLPHVARSWGMGEGAFVASGSVETVEGVLDAWGVSRARDPLSGEVGHAPTAVLVDADGHLLGATAHPARALEALDRRRGGKG